LGDEAPQEIAIASPEGEKTTPNPPVDSNVDGLAYLVPKPDDDYQE
jgi:hypothetical protein